MMNTSLGLEEDKISIKLKLVMFYKVRGEINSLLFILFLFVFHFLFFCLFFLCLFFFRFLLFLFLPKKMTIPFHVKMRFSSFLHTDCLYLLFIVVVVHIKGKVSL